VSDKVLSASDLERELADLGEAVLERSRSRGPADLVDDRTIWMFWGGPMPTHLAACIGRAERFSGDCELVVVEPDTAHALAPNLPEGWDALESWAHKSDVLAPCLLHSYGGMYVDVDTIAVSPLDELIDRFVSGDRDYVAYLNANHEPSVGVMWSRKRSRVSGAYMAAQSEILADPETELDWVGLGSPVLADAYAAAGEDVLTLEPMLGHVALFHWRAWRTLGLSARLLDPYLSMFPDHGASLSLVALYHSRTGGLLEDRPEPTLFDTLLDWTCKPDPLPRSVAEQPVTFLVKTFNRPDTAAHSVQKLREAFPLNNIIVVDDGADEHLADLERFGVAHLVMRLDSGLSLGRNVGISHISTDYFVMHDDDQFPAGDFDLSAAIAMLETQPELHAVGGWEDETPQVRDGFELDPDNTLMQHRHTSWSQLGEGPDAVQLFHMVQNQLLWRTSSFNQRGFAWSDELKVGEHVDFFFRYRGVVKVTFMPEFHFANVPSHIRFLDEAATDYARYRNRQFRMWTRFKEKTGVERREMVDHRIPDLPVEPATLGSVVRAVIGR